MAALGSQSIASSYEQLLHVDRDGGGNTTTHVSVKDGDNGTTFGFTIASDALMMTSTNRLEFGDTGTYIHQSADGVLDLVSDTEIEINATTIDMNGALDLSGNAQLSGTVTVGADGSGTDVIFYSGTAGDNFSWDASEEKLTITGTNGQTALDVADGNLVVADNVDIEGDIDVNGTSNLDAVDIDGAVQIDSTVTVGADDQGYDVIFYGDTASSNMTWDTSADDLILNDSTLYIDQDDNVGSILINSEATTAQTFYIDTPASTTGNAIIAHNCDSLTTGSIAYFHSDSSSTGTRKLVNIINDNTAATGATGLHIQQDANQKAIVIDSAATTNHVMRIDGPLTTTGVCLLIDDADALTTGNIVKLHSDSSTTNNRELLRVHNDNDSASGATPIVAVQDAQNWAMKLENGNTTNSYGMLIQAGNDTADAAVQILDKDSSNTLMVFDGSGAMRMPKAPAFMAVPSSGQANISTGSSTVAFGSERFDQGGNFASNTFTAPVTGKYQFNLVMRTDNIDSASNYLSTQLVTSNITYQDIGIWDPGPGSGDWTYWTFSWSLLVDMDTNDTAYVQITQSAGAAQVDIDVTSYFSGFLAC